MCLIRCLVNNLNSCVLAVQSRDTHISMVYAHIIHIFLTYLTLVQKEREGAREENVVKIA